MKLSGRNLFAEPDQGAEFRLTAQDTVFGEGLGIHDQKAVLPYYLAEGSISSAVAEILLAGGDAPTYGIASLFGEDEGIAEDLHRCLKEVAKSKKILLDFTRTAVKAVSTGFTLSLFSRVEQSELRYRTAREGHWIYLVRVLESLEGIGTENRLRDEFIRDLARNTGVAEACLLKGSTVQESLWNMLRGTGCFYVETQPGRIYQQQIAKGKGLIFFSPYRVSRISDEDVELIELGTILNKDA